MSEKESRKASGGKLTRSETVTVRLDPKLRYLAELAARKQRRTVSSFIEWAIEDSLGRVELYQGSGYNDPSIYVKDEINNLWDVDEADRFCKLAAHYPELLTHDEQRLWKLIKELDYSITGEKEEQTWRLFINERPIYPEIRKLWDSLQDYLNGHLNYEELLKIMQEKIKPISNWEKKQSPTVDDFDPDIPF